MDIRIEAAEADAQKCLFVLEGARIRMRGIRSSLTKTSDDEIRDMIDKELATLSEIINAFLEAKEVEKKDEDRDR